MLESFSIPLVEMIEHSKKIAESMSSTICGSEHLLLAMFESETSICHFLLSEENITKEQIQSELSKMEIIHKRSNPHSFFSDRYQELIVRAKNLADELQSDFVYEEHLFYVMLEDDSCVASELCERLHLSLKKLKEEVRDIFNFDDSKKPKEEGFYHQITDKDFPHSFYYRKEYLTRLTHVLSEMKKNHPLLIGEPGVGKTALVYAFSKTNHVPVYELDLGSIVAGTKYRGEMEEKLKKVLQEIRNKKGILFIDEIHNIVGAGSSEGTMDIANLIKPYLTKPGIQVIGATTLSEYYRYIYKDQALSRRFQNIYISEPTKEETLLILKKIAPSFESFYHCHLTVDLLKEIIEQAGTYFSQRHFPDKAIDLLDTYCINRKTKRSHLAMTCAISELLGMKQMTLADIKKEKLFYNELKPFFVRFLYRCDSYHNFGVFQVDSDFTLQPLYQDFELLLGIKKEYVLELDCANYVDNLSYSQLVGSSQGYVGYDDGGVLSNHILKHPFSIVYLKNFDQAPGMLQAFFKHLFVSNFFLDGKGRKVMLVNTCILIQVPKEVTSIGFLSNKSKNNLMEMRLKSIPKQESKTELETLLKERNIHLSNAEVLDSKNMKTIYEALLLDQGEYEYTKENSFRKIS